MVLPAGPVRG